MLRADADTFQMRRRANAGQQEQLGGLHRACGQDDFRRCMQLAALSCMDHRDAHRNAIAQANALHLGVGQHVQVPATAHRMQESA
jgi:hypothetical protein